MIEWSDQGIIVARRTFSERDARVIIFSESQGLCSGILAHAYSKKNQSLQVGSEVACTWKARLSEHMGSWSLEMMRPFLSGCYNDVKALSALTTALELVRLLLPERHPYRDLYQKTYALLESLSMGKKWLHLYVLFELHLLQEVGFGLKLESCAVTGLSEDLTYVSPKTGRAVTEAVGRPHDEKLFKLPHFMLHKNVEESTEEIKKGLRITGFFLEKIFSEQKHKIVFETRKRLVSCL